MNKKIISLVLALVMVLGTFTSVFAAETTTKKAEAKKAEAGEKVEKVVGKDNKIQYVIDKKLVEGYEDGNYGLDKNIKRSEITRLLVLANGNEELAKQLQGSMKIYSDVDTKHWANGVISVGTTVPSDANGIAMLAGYPDGSFKPENDVTYAELAKMLVVLAKKDLTADMVKNAKWATSWMTWAAQLGILDDVNVVDSNKAANRADAFTMVYNALYAMKEFKRVPANETRGIVSNFTKDVLTLNQDSKMEYKVTGETVVVKGVNGERQQIVQLKDADAKVKDYYLGSLVRILTNDKNEVTHIIELGNPAELARGEYKEHATEGKAVANDVWRGVADYTVETVNLGNDYRTAEAAQKYFADHKDAAYAKVEFKNNKVDANYINFYNVTKDETKTAVKEVLKLKVNDDTEFYVANPANNQMRKVANVNEALSLIGYQNYAEYKLAGVYAGFDNDGYKVAHKAIKAGDYRNTAKVVVFNLVNKTQDGEKYRVLESSSSKFATTIENVDGKLFDRNNMNDTSRFPLEYGDKFDVIEIDDYRTDSIYKTLIDHSKTSVYPIVEITKVDEDNKFIEIADKNGEFSLLDLRDADIFSAKRFGKLEEGNHIQFRVENNKSNVAEVISLLGKEMKLEGSIKGVLPSLDKTERRGTVVEVKQVGNEWQMTVNVGYNVFDEADKDGLATYIIANQDAKTLKKGDKIVFNVFERNYNGLFRAANIRYNNEDQTRVPEAKTAKELIQEAANIYGEDAKKLTSCADLEKAIERRDAIENKLAKLGLERTAWEKADENEAYVKAFKALKDQITKVEKNKEDAIKAADTFANDIKLENVDLNDVTPEKLVKKINTGLDDKAPVKAVKVISIAPQGNNKAVIAVTIQSTKEGCIVEKTYPVMISYVCPEGEKLTPLNPSIVVVEDNNTCTVTPQGKVCVAK
ncbi:MAG: S-layer homology domain-containing protein [Peptoniphilus harei]|uniref:S-layer homology domain-containing protein n=1 Tax=Peptoniphilus harei TaxID=54005 RepID=UPI0028FE05C0|nr:S-layer homology domain-containing protein [Peptoniphilus harei]MDU3087673.1 S-layer homology domain-containing protein [Peptoniphilus harei]